MSNDFATLWDVAAPQIRAVLRAQGVTSHAVDDIAQVTAERALRTDLSKFENPSHFTAWCIVVARRIAIDDFRRTRREVLGEVLPETVDDRDIADQVAAILACDLVSDAMAGLSASERALLFGESLATGRKESVRLAVARHRLRQRLRQTTKGLAGVLAGLRRTVTRAFQHGSDHREAIAPALGVALVVAGIAAGAAVRLLSPDVGPLRPQGKAIPDLAVVVPGTTPVTPAGVRAVPPTTFGSPSSARTLLRVPLGPDGAGSARVGFGGDAERGRLACTEQIPGRKLCVRSPVESATTFAADAGKALITGGSPDGRSDVQLFPILVIDPAS